jgi:hypothetical protein
MAKQARALVFDHVGRYHSENIAGHKNRIRPLPREVGGIQRNLLPLLKKLMILKRNSPNLKTDSKFGARDVARKM